MSTQIKRLFESAGEQSILDLEGRLGFRLPADYREFLITFNGGSTSPNVFLINTVQGESTLSILFGITSRKAYDLWANALEAYEDMDRSMLPIGEDPGGNQIVMSLRADAYGKVYFCDHEVPSPGNMSLLASTFTEFLNELH